MNTRYSMPLSFTARAIESILRSRLSSTSSTAKLRGPMTYAASAPRNARAKDGASSTSATATSAPRALHSAAFSAFRRTTRTACPLSMSALAAQPPVLPVAPRTTNIDEAGSLVIITAMIHALLLLAVLHHSFGAEYDINQPITLTGTLTAIEWTNPHTHFYVDVKDAKGNVVNWKFEGYNPSVLVRTGWRKDVTM